MVDLRTCPQCDSVNKPDAAVCRVCGSRLRAPPPRDATPVVLERVMSGEVFAAVLGEVRRGPGQGGRSDPKEKRRWEELEHRLEELDEYRRLLLEHEKQLRERETALAGGVALAPSTLQTKEAELRERENRLGTREEELAQREARLERLEVELGDRQRHMEHQAVVASARDSLSSLRRITEGPAPVATAPAVAVVAPTHVPSPPVSQPEARVASLEVTTKPPLREVKTPDAERWPLFIEGFDEAIGGGIPAGHVVLVTGTPGTLKSTLVYWALHHHAQAGHPGLYVTLEQSADGLKNHMASFGLDLSDRLTVFDAAYLRKRLRPGRDVDSLEVLKKNVASLVRKRGIRLVALDSLAALHAFADLSDRRRGFQFFEWLRDLGVTSFVIAERPDVIIDGHVIVGDYDEDFLADGVLHLRQHFLSDIEVQRRLRCVKLRGAKHDTSYMTLLWDGNAFRATRSMGE